MSYAAYDLRVDIIELFDDAARAGRYKNFAFGELTTAKRTILRSRSFTDEDLLEEARQAKPLPRIHPPLRVVRPRAPRGERGINSMEEWRRRIVTLAAKGKCVCVVCGSRSPTHRCPG